MHLFRFCALVLAVTALTPSLQAIAQESSPQNIATTPDYQSLSPEALEALVSGIALYPDAVVEQALAASFDPQGLRAAAELSPQQFQQQASQFDPGVQYLYAKEPALLDQMNQHLTLTARLGIAAQTQLDDVWAAVDCVREKYAAAQGSDESASEDPAADGYAGESYSSGGAAYPAGAFAAGLVAGNVWQEIYRGYPYHAYYPHTTTYIGPNGGTVTGGSQGVVYQNGNTTIGGKSGTAVVEGPNGTTGVVHGQGVAGATTSGNTTTFGSAASGSAATSNGLYAAGAHQGSGQVTTNPDGSTTFNRNATSGVTSNYGTTVVDHSGSGTYTGQGTGSYNGSTDIYSTHGDASVSSTAGGGQASTTVTTQNNSQTFTAGDGQLGSTSGSTARTARPTGSQSGANSWVNSLGSSQRQRLSSQTWGQMDRQAQSSFTGRNAQPVNRRDTSRPSKNLSGVSDFDISHFGNRPGPNAGERDLSGVNNFDVNRVSPSRQSPSINRSYGGGGRSRSGGRGRR